MGEQDIIDGLIKRVNREEMLSLEENLFMLRGVIGDLRRGFSRSVDTERWVADTQAYIDRIRQQAQRANVSEVTRTDSVVAEGVTLPVGEKPALQARVGGCLPNMTNKAGPAFAPLSVHPISPIRVAIEELDSILFNQRKCFAEDSDAEEFLRRVGNARVALGGIGSESVFAEGVTAVETARKDALIDRLVEALQVSSQELDKCQREKLARFLGVPMCRCGHTQEDHFAWRGMSKEELHPCKFDSCSCLKFDAWVQDPNVMTHAVCRHGVTYGERCPDCEAMKP